MSTLLQTTAVNKQFGGLAAVTDLNVRVDEGEGRDVRLRPLHV